MNWVEYIKNKYSQKNSDRARDGKGIIITSIVSVALWTVFLLVFFYAGFEKAQPLPVLSFFINGLIFYAMMLFSLKKRAFSLDLIHAFFLFSFMFFAPFIQYLKGKWGWGASFSQERILFTNLLLDCWVVFYLFTKKVRLFPPSKRYICLRKQKMNRSLAHVRVNRNFLLFCVLLSDAIALYLFIKFGTDLFSRGTNDAFVFENSSLSLIVSSVVPAFITGTTALAVFNVRPHGRIFDWVLLVMQTAALFIVCFPMGMARFQMAVVYIGLALILCPFFRKGVWFLLMMVFGLVIIFPLLDTFRSLAFDEVDLAQTLMRIVTSLVDDLTEGHYDAYTMFMLIQEYVAAHHLSYGMQLLGVVFFWVPRVLWPGKPLGSGRTAAEFFGWEFTNLSCPLPAEGFVNFGVIGVVLFAVILSKAVKKLDDTFWEGKNEIIKVVYPFLVPFFFFMMRGDLLSSFAYVCGFSVTVIAIYGTNQLIIWTKKEKQVKISRARRNQ